MNSKKDDKINVYLSIAKSYKSSLRYFTIFVVLWLLCATVWTYVCFFTPPPPVQTVPFPPPPVTLFPDSPLKMIILLFWGCISVVVGANWANVENYRSSYFSALRKVVECSKTKKSPEK